MSYLYNYGPLCIRTSFDQLAVHCMFSTAEAKSIGVRTFVGVVKTLLHTGKY